MITRPPLTVEGQENVMISLAMSLAEKQLREGTASSQVITHYLKLASLKERQELEKQKAEIVLLKAKANAIAEAGVNGKMYEEAIRAMRMYQGVDDYEDEY